MNRSKRHPAPLHPLRAVLGLCALFAGPIPTAPAEPRDVPIQRGVSYAHSGREGYGSLGSSEHLAYLNSIGFSAISITPFAYQGSITAATLSGYPSETFVNRTRGESDQAMRDEIAAAKVFGHYVVLKPHIWSRDFSANGEWHGTVDQLNAADHQTWWEAYRAMSLHFAKLAADADADGYCVGTELLKLTAKYPDEWRKLIEDIRARCRRPDGSPLMLSYAAHWEEEWEAIEFWDALDFIGVNAYFPLDEPVGADVDRLVRAWRPWSRRMERAARRWDRPIVFMEAGYRSVADCHREPWTWRGGDYDGQAQARAYEALFRVFGEQPWWRGIYLWKTYSSPGRSQRGEGDTDFTFEAKPAQQVIERWLKGT
jgi:hypothetical protein